MRGRGRVWESDDRQGKGDHEDGVDGDEGDGNGRVDPWRDKTAPGWKCGGDDGQGKGQEEGVILKSALKNRIILFYLYKKCVKKLLDW